MIEEWRSIPSFPDYEASSLGRIRRVTRASGTWPGRLLKLNKHPDGYLVVHLGEIKRPKGVHRLVCEAFNGPAPRGTECAHGDGIRNNNIPSNLRWATRKENHADKLIHGTAQHGSRNGCAKLTERDIVEIRDASARGLSGVDIAARFQVTPQAICLILKRKAWRHIA